MVGDVKTTTQISFLVDEKQQARPPAHVTPEKTCADGGCAKCAAMRRDICQNSRSLLSAMLELQRCIPSSFLASSSPKLCEHRLCLWRIGGGWVGRFENAPQLLVLRKLGRRRRTRRIAPVCLFGGWFGGNRKNTKDVASRKVDFKWHDVALPFPPSLLSNTFLAGKELRCCYKASVDGFGAMSFHQRCDFKGPCVIVGRTVTGIRVGAFSPEGYRSTDDYYDSFDAFLFYWPSSSDEEEVIVLPKVGGSGAALFDYARGGPQFGADGLLIGPPLSPVMGGFSGPETDSDQGQGQLSEARSRLGLSYAKRPDGKDSLFGDDKRVAMSEIEVFCCPAIAALY